MAKWLNPFNSVSRKVLYLIKDSFIMIVLSAVAVRGLWVDNPIITAFAMNAYLLYFLIAYKNEVTHRHLKTAYKRLAFISIVILGGMSINPEGSLTTALVAFGLTVVIQWVAHWYFLVKETGYGLFGQYKSDKGAK